MLCLEEKVHVIVSFVQGVYGALGHEFNIDESRYSLSKGEVEICLCVSEVSLESCHAASLWRHTHGKDGEAAPCLKSRVDSSVVRQEL